MNFTDKDKKVIASLLAKGRAEQEKNERFAVIDFDSFYRLFDNDEVDIFKRYLAIEPNEIGYKLPHLGIEETPNDLVLIANQPPSNESGMSVIPPQYLPTRTYEAYQKLKTAMSQEINKEVLVLYGYRSPARQVFMFFDILERIYGFDFDKTLQRVCFPAYSEHVCVQRQAIDFVTLDGIKGPDFAETKEYEWLVSNAVWFRFFESYPKDNDLGMMYEPWHWHHEP